VPPNGKAVIVFDEKLTSDQNKLVAELAEKTGYNVAVYFYRNCCYFCTPKPAGCCMSGQSAILPARTSDKAKCAKTKCDKPENK
jgi:hypothetical protein